MLSSLHIKLKVVDTVKHQVPRCNMCDADRTWLRRCAANGWSFVMRNRWSAHSKTGMYVLVAKVL